MPNQPVVPAATSGPQTSTIGGRPSQKITESLIAKQLQDIPKFKESNQIVKWANEVINILTLTDVDENIAKTAVIGALQPTATSWLNDLNWKSMSWREIVEAATLNYGGKMLKIIGSSEFERITRGPTQTVAAYGNDVREGYRLYQPNATDEQKVNKFITGLAGRLKAAMTGLESRPDTLAKAIKVAQNKEYALGIEEEARPIAPPARGVHFVDQDQEAQTSRPHSPDHTNHTYELTQRVGQLVDVLYLNRLGEG